MPSNIENIRLWKDNPLITNKPVVVKIEFKFPCTWTILNIDNLKEILRLWIIGEELKYPPSKGFEGRWLLKKEIDKLFNEVK